MPRRIIARTRTSLQSEPAALVPFLRKSALTDHSRVFEGTLKVHYGQAYLLPPDENNASVLGELGACFRGQNNGLCGAVAPYSMFLVTGTHTGIVGFTLDILAAAPPLDDTWEEIVEVSFLVGAHGFVIEDWDGDRVATAAPPAGSYRARYCARGMDQGHDNDEGDLVDFYSLAIWPAPPAPDAVLKQTSESAKYWHAAAPEKL